MERALTTYAIEVAILLRLSRRQSNQRRPTTIGAPMASAGCGADVPIFGSPTDRGHISDLNCGFKAAQFLKPLALPGPHTWQTTISA